MRNRVFTFIVVLVGILLFFSGRDTQAQPTNPAGLPMGPATVHPGRPFYFVQNAGQYDARVRFQVWGGTETTWLAEDAIWITLVEEADPASSEQDDSPSRPDRNARTTTETAPTPLRRVDLKLSFVGASPHPRLEPFNRLETKVSYFIGADPEKWHPDVPVWGGVRILDLYPGITLELTGENGQMVQHLVAQPGAVLDAVRLRVEGADAILLEDDGLRLETEVGSAWVPFLALEGRDRFSADPGLVGDEVIHPFANRVALAEVAKKGGPETAAGPAVGGPADLRYATFLGGSQTDSAWGIVANRQGEAYVSGWTRSPDFPAVNGPGYDTTFSYWEDAFVVKLAADGMSLIYATFLGGIRSDYCWDLAVDGTGQAYITGETLSDDFPAAFGPGYDTSRNGGWDVFVVKLNPTGTAIVYATYLGGSHDEYGKGIALDGQGRAYVVGSTRSTNFIPVNTPGYDNSPNGGDDGFVARLAASGMALEYGTYLGSTENESANSVTVDEAGQAYVTGWTASRNFPAVGGPGYDTSHNGGSDAFVVKLNATGTALVYATFLGGAQADIGKDIAVDGLYKAYVVGTTQSITFPASLGPGYDTSYNAASDAFMVKLESDGMSLNYATYLGGTITESDSSIVIDATGTAYISGSTNSATFPAASGPGYDTSPNGNYDAFLVRLSSNGMNLLYATFLGSSESDYGYRAAIDEMGNAFVVGTACKANFPATDGPGYDTSYGGGCDGYVVKLAVADLQHRYLPMILHRAWSVLLTPTPTPTRTPTATPTPATLTDTYFIAAGSDDAYSRLYGCSTNTLKAGDIAGDDITAGIRFLNVQKRAGRSLVDAHLVFVAAADASGLINLKVVGDNEDNAATFDCIANSPNQPHKRPATSQSITWNPTSWVAGNNDSTPNIASVVAAVLNRAGWVNGNALAILVKDDGSSTSIQARNYESGAPYIKLMLTWQ